MHDQGSGTSVRVRDMPREEQRRFHAFAYGRLQRSLLTLMFAMPALLLVGWIRDYVVDGPSAIATLAPRATLVVVLVCLVLPLRLRTFHGWQELLGILYLGVYGIGIAATTLHEPARLSMLHVATALMLLVIIFLLLIKA